MPGVYTMVVHVNKNDLPEQPVTFMAPERSKGSETCLSPELVNQLGLKEKLLSTLNWTHGGRCLDASSLAGMEARGDLASSSLYLNIPQAYLEYSSKTGTRLRAGMTVFLGCCLTITSTPKRKSIRKAAAVTA